MPVCPVCGVIWSIVDSDTIMGDAGDAIMMSYMQSRVDLLAPHIADQINAYTRSKEQRQKLYDLKKNMHRIHDTMKPVIRAKRAFLQHQINTVIPPHIDPPSLKRRADDDTDHLSCLSSIFDHLHQAFRLYNTKLPEMSYGFYEMWQQGLIQVDTYGKTLAKVYFERDILIVMIDAIAKYLALPPTDKPAFGTVCKFLALTKMLPEKTVMRVNWSALTVCIQRINETYFPRDKFPIFPHTTTNATCSCVCGMTRSRERWISQCTSKCPSCLGLPGILFYFMNVGCDVADSFRYATHSMELYVPKHTFPEIQTAIMGLKRCHEEMNDMAAQLDAQMNDHNKQMSRIRTTIEILRQEYYKTTEQGHVPPHIDRPFFDVIRCDVETCCGMVDLVQGHCFVCNQPHCPRCWKPTDDTHVCTEQALKNVSMIKKTSKQCPMCRCVIQRTEGCPIMFCTQCRSGFDYDTGARITGLIDNPHYYDMLFSEETPPVYPTEGFPSLDILHRFNDFSLSEGSEQPDPDLVQRVLARSLRALLSTSTVDMYHVRHATLSMLGFEQVLKYICGDDTLGSVVQTYRLIHRLETYAWGMQKIIQQFMQPDQSREELLRLADDAASLCKRTDTKTMHHAYSLRVTELREL